MGYSVELVGVVFLNQGYKQNFTIFMGNSQRMLFAIMGNVTFCSVSMLYMLIYLKYKNKIKSNYIFLLLVLPMLQIFTFQKYSSFLQKDVTIQILVIGTVFFTFQIFMNIIVLNLVMKSILSYNLGQKVYMANLENEKNSYVRDLYKNQKIYFKDLLNNQLNLFKGVPANSISKAILDKRWSEEIRNKPKDLNKSLFYKTITTFVVERLSNNNVNNRSIRDVSHR